MATMTVDCGSFNKTSYNGVTQYGSIVNFTIPAGATITGCSVSFTTHAASGQTNDRAFSLNGARAHSGWPSTGMSLDAGLLSPGGNTFRVSLKSQTASGSEVVSCTWNISGITLSITYTEGGTPAYNPGTVSISKTSLTAGESLTVSVSSASDGVYRNVYIRRVLSGDNLLAVVAQHGSGAGSWAVTIPTSWCTTLSPDAPSFELRAYMVSYLAGSIQVGEDAKMFTVNVPASAVPTMGAFTATLVPNGVPGTIAGYVQNKSKVTLAMGSVAGAMGSTIASYKISGGGMTAYAQSATLGPFSRTGDVVFTAVATDTRGRTATRQVAINIMPYTAPAFSSPTAWRSNYDGVKNQKGTYVRLKSGVSFSSLGEQNEVTLKGRVYIKGGEAPAWETMTPDTELILGGGALLFTRTYIAQIQVSDLLGSRITEFIIPTKKTGLSIMAGMSGAAIGKSAETPGILDVAWPIVAPGIPPNPNILHNWDFTNPVNQRGLATASDVGYWLDRWTLNNVSGATYTYSNVWGLRGVTTTNNITMRQYIENPNAYAGKTVTVSVEIYSASVTAGCTIRLWCNGTTEIGLVEISDGDTGIKSFTATIPNTALTDLSVAFYNYGGNDVRIKRIKLELGTGSTLHLDPPMDVSSEFVKCKRFFKVIKASTNLYGFIANATTAICYLLAEGAMRTLPTISGVHTANLSANGTGFTGAEATAVSANSDTGLRITFTRSAGGMIVNHACIAIVLTGQIDLSADL